MELIQGTTGHVVPLTARKMSRVVVTKQNFGIILARMFFSFPLPEQPDNE
jgi:hypothetical protein